MADLRPPTVTAGLHVLNNLPVSVCLYWIDPAGGKIDAAAAVAVAGGATSQTMSRTIVTKGSHAELPDFMTGTYVVTCELTGAFVCSMVLTKLSTLVTATIDQSLLTAPNSLPYPVPDQFCPIPGDSPRVLVAAGQAGGGAVVVREQYWHLTSESFVLAPHATHTISQTRTSGRLETTSEQTDVSASLGLSASGGWGPVSASVSATLSQDSSTSQQFTVSSTDTRFEEITHTNATDSPLTYLVWQLIDQILVIGEPADATVAAKTPLAILANIASAQTPTLVAGPYSSGAADL